MRARAILFLMLFVGISAYTQNLTTAKIETGGNTTSSTFVVINGTASISDADAGGNTTDYFTVNYVHAHPSTSGYNINNHDANIDHVSSSEYWIVDRNGTNNINLSLSWNSRSGGVNEVNDLVVAHWNGSQWNDMGNAGVIGDTIEGTIISELITSFSPFTLASKSENNTLPIKLTTFSANCSHGVITIFWESATEVNSAYYSVAKSFNGNDWEVLSKTVSNKRENISSSYMVVDNDNFGKGSYYRLIHTDNDGQNIVYQTTYCDACNQESGTSLHSVVPNPASDFISITSTISEESFLLELFDCNGKIIRKEISSLNKKINVKDLDTGSYYYRINKNESGKLLIIR